MPALTAIAPTEITEAAATDAPRDDLFAFASDLVAADGEDAGEAFDAADLLLDEIAEQAARDVNAFIESAMTEDAIADPINFPDPVWSQPPLFLVIHDCLDYALRSPDRRGLLLHLPPEHYKSVELVNRFAWMIGRGAREILAVSADIKVATRNTQAIRVRLLSDFQRRVFPDMPLPAGLAHGAERQEWNAGLLKFAGDATPVWDRRASQAEDAGTRARLLWLDDCFTARGAMHPTIRDQQWFSVKTKWLQRAGKTGKVIITNNNRHPKDGFHSLRETGDFVVVWGGVRADFSCLEVMISGLGEDFTLRDYPGVTARWEQAGLRLAAPLLPGWSAQAYGQQERALGPTEFRRIYIGVDEPPEQSVFGLRETWGWEAVSADGVVEIMGVLDPNGKQSEREACYTGLTLLARLRDGRLAVIWGAMKRAAWDVQAQMIAEALDWCDARYPGVTQRVFVEDNANQGSSLAPEIAALDARRSAEGLPAIAPRVAYRTTQTNKDQRIMTLGGPIRSRELVFALAGDGAATPAPEISEAYLAQQEDYPSAFRDGVDSQALAYEIARGPVDRVFDGASLDALRPRPLSELGVQEGDGSPALVAAHLDGDGVTRGVVARVAADRRLIVVETFEAGGSLAEQAATLRARLTISRRACALTGRDDADTRRVGAEWSRLGASCQPGASSINGLAALQDLLSRGRVSIAASPSVTPELTRSLRELAYGRTDSASLSGPAREIVWPRAAGWARALMTLAYWSREVRVAAPAMEETRVESLRREARGQRARRRAPGHSLEEETW